MPTEHYESLVFLDWLVIVLFFAATLVTGLVFSKKGTSSLADFFVAGRKMTWWVAGTSIVATTFAADTPLVISKWLRTDGLDRNWFWWGGIMGAMMCTFFFARLWRRSGVLTDVEFIELRYSGAPAAGLRLFHATFRSLIQNTVVMGWVTLAMVKILEIALDIPTVVFVKGQWLPELVASGVGVYTQIDPGQIAAWPLIGEAIVPAKIIGIFACFSVAAIYSSVSGLWGIMATDFFQFSLAMVGTVVLMFIVYAAVDGPSNMVQQAARSVNQGLVHNQAATDRHHLPREGLIAQGKLDATTADRVIQQLLGAGLVSQRAKGVAIQWAAHGLTQAQIDQRIEQLGIDDAAHRSVINLWKTAYTANGAAFSSSSITQRLLSAGVIVNDFPGQESPAYYRFPDSSMTEDELHAQLDQAGIDARGEVMAAWRHDKVVTAPRLTSFLPPFDLKGGGFLVVWSFVVFLGVQWWVGADGGGFLAQRLFACKNEKHSVMAMIWYCFAHYGLRPWPWIVVGVASLYLIPDVTAFGKHYDAEHAYVIMIMKYLPVGLKGLLIASLMAAYMSTISTHVNFGASYLVNDVYKRFLFPGASERSYVIASQLVSVFLAVLAGIYAYYSSSVAGGWYIFFELVGGAGLALLLRWYWWRISAWSEIAGMTASLANFILIKHTQVYHSLFESFGLPVYWLDEFTVRFTLNLVVSTACWVAVTFIFPAENQDHLIRFYNRVRPPGWWNRVAREAGVSKHISIGLREWACWLLGSTGLFAMIFALGHFCFAQIGYGLAFTAYAVLATWLIMKLMGRMDWSEVAEPDPVSNNG